MQHLTTIFFHYFILSVLFELRKCNPARVDLREHDLSHISREQLRRIVGQNENEENGIATDDENLLERLYNQTMSQQQTNGTRCSDCKIREDQKKHRLQSIKNRISHALRLDTLGMPNMTNAKLPKIPQFQKLKQRYEIREALRMQNDESYRSVQEDYEEEYGQSQRTYIFAQNPPDELQTGHSAHLYFDTQDLIDKVLGKALLWVYVNPTLQQNVTEIYLYSLIHDRKKRNASPRKHLLSRKKRNSRGWQHFNILNELEKWLEEPTLNNGLVVEAFDANGRNLVVMPSTNDDGYAPVLDTKTIVHRHHGRGKRSIYLNCDEEHVAEACCRYKLVVDFVDFGWDFIIAPLNYDAYYCAGECRNQHIDANAHAHLIEQSRDHMRPEHGPCCSPTRMGPLSMLYFDHLMNIQFTTLPRMKVERCGCA